MISQKVAKPEEWKTKYEAQINDWKASLDKILSDEEKGYLSNSLTPIFVDKLNRTLDSFMQIDFATVEASFVQELDKYPANTWPQVNKASIWKTIATNAMSDFQTQTSALGFSDNAKQQLTSLLQGVISNNTMLVYERYLRFKGHYESVKAELVQMAKDLSQVYSTMSEEQVLSDWSEVSFNSPIMKTKQEVMDHLNEILKKYGG